MMTSHPKLRMYSFAAGRIHTQGVRFIAADGREQKRDMADPNHCYLISHPGGLLIWDTGLPDSIAALPGQTLRRGKFQFVVEQPLAAQLAEIGVQPDEIGWLAFSHLQIDHAGNTALFPRADVLIQTAEYRMAFGPEAQDWGYHTVDYAALDHQNVVQLTGDQDVFGDGQVVILSAPGHTPGHQVLYVNLPSSGPVLLSGDLYYAEQDPTEGWMPAWNYDKAETRITMQRMETFRRERGAQWIINHDPDRSFSGWME